MKRKKQVKQFRAWVIADGEYRAGPLRSERMLMFGSRDHAVRYIHESLRKDVPWEPVEVVCKRVPKRRKAVRK